jgi:hypothetical protein
VQGRQEGVHCKGNTIRQVLRQAFRQAQDLEPIKGLRAVSSAERLRHEAEKLYKRKINNYLLIKRIVCFFERR